jgi:polysaccharide export outer membrane protein
MKKYLSTITFLCFVGAAVVIAQEDKSVAIRKTAVDTAAKDSRSGYLIGVADEIEIKVLGEPDFSGNFTVNEDGTLQLGFDVPPITAVCRTERELRGDVVAALKKYLRDPQVNVRVTEKRSRPPAVVYGEVRAPQQFDMRRAVRLLELLSYTGGKTEQASGLVELTHTRPATCFESGEIAETSDSIQNQTKVFRWSDIQSGKAEFNPIVRPGDVINIPKTFPVYVVGEVIEPKGYFIPENGLTLTDAVAMARGLTPTAKKKDVRVYRLKPNSNQREMISFNLDLIKKGQQPNIELQPYDIVEVDKAPKSIAQVLSEIASGTVRATTAALPYRIIP